MTEYKLPKKEIEYLDKMMPTVIADLKDGRHFSATIQSIRSGILVSEWNAYKQYYIDKKIIDKDSNFISDL